MPLPLMTLLRPTPRTLRVGVLLVMVLGPFAARAEDKSAVSPNHIKLPTGPGSLEGVGENAQINYAMGLMSWGMDLEVPQGREGLTPALRLSYSSGAGRSTLGIGWSLGVSSIERLTVHGLPGYGVDDTFGDGSSELVFVGLQGSDRLYRARFEGGFVRYRWVDPQGADYWVAELPDGNVQYYGATRLGAVTPSAREEGPLGTFRYCLVEVVNPFDETLRYDYVKSGGAALLAGGQWLFLNGTPRYRFQVRYQDREDHLVNAKPGFAVVLDKRVDDILITANGMQRRRYDFIYEAYAASGGLTRLSGVRTYGTDDAQPYGVRFDFSYANTTMGACTTPGCFSPALVTMGGSVGPGLFAGQADLVDLNGDALPDVLDTSNGAHAVFLNAQTTAGAHRFEAEQAIAGASASLAAPGVRMVDLDGDGFADLYDAQNGVVHHGTGALAWRTVSAAFAAPDMGVGSNFTFTDVDGDKQIDIFYADGTDTYYLRNTGGAFATVPTIAVPPDSTYVPDVDVGIAAGLQLADMNGDGLSDAVFVNTAGLLAYRVNYGRGLFGADIVEMTGLSPNTIPGQFKLADLNGDGLGDGVVVAPGLVSVFLNRNGVAFGARTDIRGDGAQMVPDGTATDHQVRFADMTGDGSVDVVWVNAAGSVTYLDFYQLKPNLLVRIDNGIGKHIQATYGTAAQHMATAGGPAAWRYRLPHPMLTVDSVDSWDDFTNIHQLVEVTYRDGFYDGEEDRFRGFEQAVVVTRGDASIETGRTTTMYDVGATDPYRNSLPVLQRTESQGASGFRVLEEVEQRYQDCPVAGVGTTTPAVRFICQSEKVTRAVEGLAASETREMRVEYTYDGYGNKILEANHGVVSVGGGGCAACTRPAGVMGAPCGAQCLGDESFVEDLMVPPPAAGRWILRKPMVKTGRAVRGGDVFVEKHFHYDGVEFVGLPLGELQRGALTRVQERVNAGADVLIDAQRFAIGAKGEVVASKDALGTLTTLEYDTHRFQVVAEEKHLEGAGHAPYGLRIEAAYHPILDSVVTHTSWMRTEGGQVTGTRRETHYAYDAFGRPIAMAAPGDTLASPTQVYAYNLQAPVSSISYARRSAVSPAAPLDLLEKVCFEGMGREIHKVRRIDAGRSLVSDFKVQNSRGAPAQEFQNFETPTTDCQTTPPTWVPHTRRRFDAKGRLLELVHPDADIFNGVASVERTEYLPLATRVFDSNDNASAAGATPVLTLVDGLERAVRIEHQAPNPMDVITFDMTYDQTGHLRGTRDTQGHERIQEYDLLGRLVRQVDPESGEATNTYDARGNRLTRTDARGTTVAYTYDEVSRPIASYDAANPEETRVTLTYDRVPDCVTGCDAEGELTAVAYPRGADRIIHDGRLRAAVVERRLDGHTLRFGTTYDNADRPISRSFPGEETLDYTLDGLGRVSSIAGLVDSIGYDAKSMPALVRYANNTSIQYQADSLNRLSRLEARGANNDIIFGQALTWDRNGNVLAVQDLAAVPARPGTTAEYQYDGHNRLVAAVLDRGRPGLEETLSMRYDALDRMLETTSSLGQTSRQHVGAYAYDPAKPRRAVQAGSTTLSYDAAGNVVQLDATALAWDYLGRLTEKTAAGRVLERNAYGPGHTRVIRERGDQLSYYFDPEFEVHGGIARISAKIGKHVVATITTTAMAPDFVPDVAPTGAPDGRITSADAFQLQQTGAVGWEAALSAAVLATATAGDGGRAVEFVYHDYLGSPAVRLDALGGNPVYTGHGPFGALRADRREAGVYALVDRGFAGEEFEDAQGVVHFGVRDYVPRLGLFLSLDPTYSVLDKDGLARARIAHARYAFAAHNPTSYRDDQGRDPAAIIGFILGALIGAGTPILEACVDQFREHGTEFKDWKWTGDEGVFSSHTMKEALWGALTDGAMGALTHGAGPAKNIAQLFGTVAKEVLIAVAPRIVELLAEQLGATEDEANAIADVLDMVVAGKHILHAVDHHNMARLQGLMERSLKSVAENNKLVGVVVIGLNNTVHKVYEGLHNLTHGQMSGTWSFLAKTWNSFEVGGPTGVMWTGAGFAGGQDDASAGPKEHH